MEELDKEMNEVVDVTEAQEIVENIDEETGETVDTVETAEVPEMKYSKNTDDLKAIAGETHYDTRNDWYQVDPRLVVVENEFNVRNFIDEDVQEHVRILAESIKGQGVLTPLLVRKGVRLGTTKDDKNKDRDVYQYIVVDGECRLRAIQLLIEKGIHIRRIPVRLVPQSSNEADWLKDMIGSNESLKFKPMELALAYGRLLKFGYSEEEIARDLGKTLPYVKQTLKLLESSPDIIKAAREDKITASDIRKAQQFANVEKGDADKTEKRIFAENKLREYMEKQAEDRQKLGDGSPKKKVNLDDIIGGNPKKEIVKEVKKNESEIFLDAMKLVLKHLPVRDNYSRTDLERIPESIDEGRNIKDAINEVFGIRNNYLETGSD
jgi:ParB/RepB/Spo0J family partition protein